MSGVVDDATWAPQSPKFDDAYKDDSDDFVHPQHRGFRGSVSHSLPYSPPSTISSPTAVPPTPFPLPVPVPVPVAPPLHAKLSPPALIPMPRGLRRDESMQDADYLPESDAPSMPMPMSLPTEKTRGKAVKREEGAAADVNITVHFPVARIKRIMQADDDVGKVAQVTPVVVSKALELFMISLVTKSAAEAKARNSKRVGAIHLKQAIANDQQFDFLSDIVAKVADAPAAAEKTEDAMEVDGGKKRKTSSRRKKKSDDDDF